MERAAAGTAGRKNELSESMAEMFDNQKARMQHRSKEASGRNQVNTQYRSQKAAIEQQHSRDMPRQVT